MEVEMEMDMEMDESTFPASADSGSLFPDDDEPLVMEELSFDGSNTQGSLPSSQPQSQSRQKGDGNGKDQPPRFSSPQQDGTKLQALHQSPRQDVTSTSATQSQSHTSRRQAQAPSTTPTTTASLAGAQKENANAATKGKGRGRGRWLGKGTKQKPGTVTTSRAAAVQKPNQKPNQKASTGRGRRQKVYEFTKAQAAHERAAEIKATYSAAIKAVKPALQDLAERTISKLRSSKTAHTEVPQHVENERWLQGQLDQVKRAADIELAFNQQMMINVTAAQFKSTEDGVAVRTMLCPCPCPPCLIPICPRLPPPSSLLLLRCYHVTNNNRRYK
jgi:hypothetical protein